MGWQWLSVIALVSAVLFFGCIGQEARDECFYFNGPFSDAKAAAPEGTCLMTETEGYIAYIPAQVRTGERVPMLAALSPEADADSMISVLRPTADNLSVVIVASKESQNGLTAADVFPGYDKLMDDAVATLPVDERRIIFGGMSGGGQASYIAAYYYPERVRGVITNCGKIMPEMKDGGFPHGKLVVFLASETDFNYDVMKEDKGYLEALGWRTHWIEFEGGHALAPPETYLEATTWLLKAMG